MAAGVEDAVKASTSVPAGGLLGSGVLADRRAAANVRAPPWPAYEPKVIYRYPGPAAQSAAAAELSDKEIASLCFPNNVRCAEAASPRVSHSHPGCLCAGMTDTGVYSMR